MRPDHRLWWWFCRTAQRAACKNKIELLHSILLDFVPAHGQHTGSSTAKLFSEVLQFYSLTNSVQGKTTNSNFTFSNELKKNIPDIDSIDNHFVCFAHILNLGARDFMKIPDLELEESDNTLSENSQIDDDEINGEVQLQSPVKKIRSVEKNIEGF
nr:unnamed protein product [Callosobruchus analis]